MFQRISHFISDNKILRVLVPFLRDAMMLLLLLGALLLASGQEIRFVYANF